MCVDCGSDEGVRAETHLYPICTKCIENKKQPKKKPTRKFAAKAIIASLQSDMG